MARDRDDALSWEGDDDPTLDVRTAPATAAAEPAAEAAPPALPDGFTAVGKNSATVGRRHADGTVTMPGEREPMGNTALIGFGILGGVYLLYIVGWIFGGLRLQGQARYLVTDVMFQGSLWLAILAPALWFATTLLLTRRARPWLRIVWLVAGAVLLIPWPFILVGVIGQ